MRRSNGPPTEEIATTLCMWIPKFLCGGIVVEGYRSVSQKDLTNLQNWQSTRIVTRKNARTLSTKSGSVYLLKGGIDDERAEEEGVPAHIVEQFARGFPENWKEIVDDYYAKVNSETNANGTAESDKRRVSSVTNRSFTKRKSTTGRLSMLPTSAPSPIPEESFMPEMDKKRADKKAEEDKENVTELPPTKATEERDKSTKRSRAPSKSPRNAKTPAATPKTPEDAEQFKVPTLSARQRAEQKAKQEKDIANLEKNALPFTHWVFRFVRGGSSTSIFPNFEFKVCGFRTDMADEEWSTSGITRVIPPRIVMTLAGAIYRLDGPFDVERGAMMGFPKHFMDAFVDGFPEDWQKRLSDFFSVTFEQAPPRIVEVASDDATIRGSDSNRELSDEDEEDQKKEETRESTASSQFTPGEKKEFDEKNKGRWTTPGGAPLAIASTPNAQPTLRTSRSGRTLRRPMAEWAGARISYDAYGNPIAVSGATTQSKLVSKDQQTEVEKVALHFGMSPSRVTPAQKETQIEFPKKSSTKKRRSKQKIVDYSSSDDDRILFEAYKEIMTNETPAIVRKGVSRARRIDSDDEEQPRKKLRYPSSSSDSEVERKRKPAKKQKKRAVKKEKQEKVRRKRREEEDEREEEEEHEDEEEEDEEPEDDVSGMANEDRSFSLPPPKERAPTKQRARPWRKNELIRLKVAVGAVAAGASSDVWEVIAKSLGGERTAEECKKAATQKLNMKVDEERRAFSPSSLSSETESDEEGRKWDDGKKKDEIPMVTAKKGTVSHSVQVDQAMRHMMLDEREGGDDCFEGGTLHPDATEVLPSVAQFDPDDSLLSCLATPVGLPTANKPRVTRRAQQASEESLASSPLNDSTPQRNNTTRFLPSPKVDQGNLARYVHHLKKNNVSMLSHSVVDRSRLVGGRGKKGDTSRVLDVTREVAKVEKIVKRNTKRKTNIFEEDEDEDEEDEEEEEDE